MDVLKDKQYREFEHVSRYSVFPLYYNTLDNKYIYGITSQLSSLTDFVSHKVSSIDTFDSLALKYYGRPDLYWVISDFNHINDPFITLWGNYKVIKIPSISNISFKK